MKKYVGFTLIELMIVVAIISLLAALAYPSYMASVRKSNRAEAKVWLTDVSQRMQRCYTTYGRFDDPTNTKQCGVLNDLNVAGGIISQPKLLYSIKVSNLAQSTFRLTATAILDPQMGDTGCTNTMTIDQRGTQLPVTGCW